MPEEGINFVPRADLLSYEEMVRLVELFIELGITKLRITGGEPFLRKDMVQFLEKMGRSGLEQLHITTNGTLSYDIVPRFKEMGITSVNLSLDSLDRQRFHEITRRDQLDRVLATFHRLLEYEIPTKINMVVMGTRNTDDIIPMSKLAREYPVTVRYIEEMPFNGVGARAAEQMWNHRQILERLQAHLPPMQRVPTEKSATASVYQVDGFKGKIGIIAAYSRTFCGSCNRLRITPQGMLRTCLYDQGIFNVRDLLRAGATDEQIKSMLLDAVVSRAKDGFEAERRRGHLPVSESMSTIGG